MKYYVIFSTGISPNAWPELVKDYGNREAAEGYAAEMYKQFMQSGEYAERCGGRLQSCCDDKNVSKTHATTCSKYVAVRRNSGDAFLIRVVSIPYPAALLEVDTNFQELVAKLVAEQAEAARKN